MSVLLAGAIFAGCGGSGNSDGDKDDGDAHTHTYQWSVATSGLPTQTVAGTATGTCTANDSTVTVEIPALTDSRYTVTDNTATATEAGTGTYTITLNDPTYGEIVVTFTAETPAKGGEEEEEVPTQDTSTPLPAANKIYLVGDSTVCSFTDNYYLPRYGYGTQIAEYFNVTSNQVQNLALSGRSSLSYLSEANYTTLKNSIGEGDYLIIGFGHNDEKSDDADRFTDPAADYQTATTAKGPSFAYTLYENYVKLAEDAGATAILCTPIVRYSSSANYNGSNGHITDDGDYAQAIRKLGEDTGTTVVDLTEITKNIYTALGENAIYFHAHSTYNLDGDDKIPAGLDGTHINKYGAKRVAYEFASALKSTECGLAAHVKTNAVAPTYENDFADAVNEAYVKPNYTPFDPTNTKATNLTGDWYATVMGDVGGSSKITTYTISYAEQIFTIDNVESGNNGKFAAAGDGFGAAFIQVDASKNFTASATVSITGMSSKVSAESGFGIMLRDDIYIDTYSTAINSNYVAAGTLASTGGAIFSRENTTLTKHAENTVTVEKGSTYTVSLTRVGQVVTVTFSDGTHTYTERYTDFDFLAVDSQYMYLCLFANRGLGVEFSNVSFEYTGDAQGA